MSCFLGPPGLVQDAARHCTATAQVQSAAVDAIAVATFIFVADVAARHVGRMVGEAIASVRRHVATASAVVPVAAHAGPQNAAVPGAVIEGQDTVSATVTAAALENKKVRVLLEVVAMGVGHCSELIYNGLGFLKRFSLQPGAEQDGLVSPKVATVLLSYVETCYCEHECTTKQKPTNTIRSTHLMI